VRILTVIIGIALSLFSTIVMSYISMAIVIGPWIAPTLVLIAMLIFNLFKNKTNISESIALATAAGSVGGILATAFGFSFPTLYFLDPNLFNSWMAKPFYFSAVLTGLALVAGWFGIWIANVFEERLIIKEKLSFPIGELVHKTIAAQHQIRKAYELLFGFVATAFFCVLQNGAFGFKRLIPKQIVVSPLFKLSIFRFPRISFDTSLLPMFLAIGFVTGHLIALPLAVGALSKILLMEPINYLFFPSIDRMEFIFAFCSGMVLSGALVGMIKTPKTLWKGLKQLFKNKPGESSVRGPKLAKSYCIELVLVLTAMFLFFTYFEFSLLSQCYLFFFSLICTYQMAVIAGKIGLAQLGRFATFVMVPAMFLFSLNMVQIVLIATFVEVCGGVAVDVLFGRKLAFLRSINRTTMQRYQYLGLLVSALSIGIVFWLLIDHFHLGSSALFAQRSQARQLLINVRSFDYCIAVKESTNATINLFLFIITTYVIKKC